MIRETFGREPQWRANLDAGSVWFVDAFDRLQAAWPDR
jgi:hypothetical protein